MPAENKGMVLDLESEITAFEESKAGVKGLVDAGVTKIPKFFIHTNSVDENNNNNNNLGDIIANNNSNNNGKNGSNNNVSALGIPLIDLQGILGGGRGEVVAQVKSACEEFGFFQLVNHGVRAELLEEMLDGVRRFHEQDVDVKKQYYSRDYENKSFLYNSNYNLLQAKAAAWRDTFTFIRGSSPPDPQHLPPVCRDILIEYTNEVMKLGETLYELLSEALGLHRDYLKSIGCNDGIFSPCNYYPGCPEPQLTLGSAAHADSGFITVLLQSQIRGLQVLYKGRWIDVDPIPGALVVNMGNLMQLISNDKFVSALHRVLASKIGPRTSMACIFRAHHHPQNTERLYEPIRELLSPENPASYRAVTVKDIISNKHSSHPGKVGNALDKFRI